MKTALVTGAHGFLGRHVALDLSKHGYAVYGVGHGDWSSAGYRSWGLTAWSAATVDVGSLSDLPIAPQLIIHCAGGSAVSVAENQPTLDFARTLASTAAVLEVQKTKWPEAHLVLASSAAVYGVAEEQPLRETSPLSPVSVYGLHKLLAEQAVQFYAKQFALKASIVRLFSVYGVGLRKQLFWDACIKLTSGEITFPGTGQETRDWLHVADAASLLRIAGERRSKACLLLNGGTGTARSVREALDLIARSIAPNSRPQFSKERRSGDPTHYEADISVARALGWEPEKDFERSIMEYCDWFRMSASA